MNKLLIASLTAFCLLFSTSRADVGFYGSALRVPPQDDYQEYNTEHFKVVYPRALDELAREAGPILEKAHEVVSRAFEYEPAHRVTVLLTDNQDSANGVTAPIGLQGLILYVTAPDPYSSIGEYDHWLYSLIVHEYAHYLTLEQTRGAFKDLRAIFGNLIFPNGLWPMAITEGMAVYAESLLTSGGRGYGTYFETITRDGIYHGRLGTDAFLSYAKLLGTVPDYPFGGAYYYAGFALIDQMAHEYGAKAPTQYARISAGRAPFFTLNSTLGQLSPDRPESTLSNLWRNWIDRQTRRLRPELEWLRSNGAPEPRFFTGVGASATGARLSPDGSVLAYGVSSSHDTPKLELAHVATGKARKIDDAAGVGQLSWSEDGKTLYYSKLEFEGPYALYSDLYAYDTTRRRVKRLTHGLRAKDPDACGQWLVFTSDRKARSELRALNLLSGEEKLLYRAPRHHHVATPRCGRDSSDRRVYFTNHGTEPMYSIHSVPLEGKTATGTTAVVGGKAAGFGALFPDPQPDGGLIFTRARDGYFDIALLEPGSKSVKVLARSSGGYWMPQKTANGFAVTYLSSRGIRAGILTGLEQSAPERRIEQAPTSLKRLASEQEPQEFAASAPTSRSYSGAKSLGPRVWFPYLMGEDDHAMLGAGLIGWDEVDQINYMLGVWYDNYPKQPGAELTTGLRLGSLQLGLDASSAVESTYKVDGQRMYWLEREVAISLSRPFPGVFSTIVPSLSAEWSRSVRDGDGENTQLLLSPAVKFGANLTYSSRKSFAYSIAPEKGALGTLAARRYVSPAGAWKYLAGWQQLFGAIPSHSSLSLKALGAATPRLSQAMAGWEVVVGDNGDLDDLDLPLRGYRYGALRARQAATFQADYHVPIFQVFRNVGGNFPVFVRNLGAFAFADAAILNESFPAVSGPVTGAGLGAILNLDMFYTYPGFVRVQYSHGFEPRYGGEDSVNVQFSLGLPVF